MAKWYLLLLTILCATSCDYYVINPHKHQVGHISQGQYTDNPDFKLCYKEVLWPGHFDKEVGFKYGIDSLRRYFYKNYDHQGITDQSGYITIRFVVNCEGKVGLFEVRKIGADYKPKDFHPELVDQLVNLTRALNEWNAFDFNDFQYDSFTHITFKIDNGELSEILS